MNSTSAKRIKICSFVCSNDRLNRFYHLHPSYMNIQWQFFSQPKLVVYKKNRVKKRKFLKLKNFKTMIKVKEAKIVRNKSQSTKHTHWITLLKLFAALISHDTCFEVRFYLPKFFTDKIFNWNFFLNLCANEGSGHLFHCPRNNEAEFSFFISKKSLTMS